MQVLKRNGNLESFDVSKIKKCIDWASEGLDINAIELESKFNSTLYEGIQTNTIQNKLIESAKSLVSVANPDWVKMAGRLSMMSLWKSVALERNYPNYVYDPDKYSYLGYYSQQLNKNNYSDELNLFDYYSINELEEVTDWIDYSRDLDYDYAGVVSWSRAYLVEHELPQEAILTISLMIAAKESNRLTLAKEIYDAISLRKISLATPFLANLRRFNGSLSSCFIISMEDDSISILDAVREAALISKNGGGVGIYLSNLRCSGSLMRGKYSKGVGGVIPYAQLFNATALAWNQGGVRKGAFTLALDVWHYDVLDFLDLRLENKDNRLTAHDIFPQLCVNNLFLTRLENKEQWTLLDPHEVYLKTGKELGKLWGKEFEEVYLKAEDMFLKGELKIGKTIEAKEILKRVFKSWEQSGLPYIFFKDTVNELNPNYKTGMIPSANLCVAPETLVLTDKGHLPIGTLENKVVNVWNGEEFSTTTIRKTGTNQELLKVVLSNGVEIECTPYHHFYIKDKGKNKFIKVEAQALNIGDKLIKYELPIIEGSEEFPYAYTHGFYCGDGSDGYSQGEAKFPSASLYGEKRNLLPYLDVRKKLWSNGTTVIEREEESIFEEPHLQRIRCNFVSDLPPKFTVPNNTYTIQSRVEWLAGLLDSDGTVARNEGNESFQITSINKQFLLDIKNMLQTLGVDSKVTKNQEAEFKSMPDGKGDYKDYYCQQSYRLLINSNDLFKLKELGLKTNRLKWTGNKPQRSASQFIKVEKVIRTNRISDTYCFTETKRHMGMFNGVLTGQCVESYSNVSSQFTHVCNLISLNLSNCLTDQEIAYYTRLSVKALDIAIDLTVEPTAKALAHNNFYRVIGLGSMGLHDHLAYKQLQYGTSKALQEVKKVFELVALNAARESVELAYKGLPDGFNESTWNEGKIYSRPLEWYWNNALYYDEWVELQKEISAKGIRNTQLLAIAPNTSSALIQGCTPSVFPARDKIYAHSKGNGTMDVVVPHIKEGFWYYKPAKAYTPEQIIEVVQEIQKWTDTGISMELLVDLNDEEQRTAKYLYDRIMQAWKGGSKAIYYVRFLTKSENVLSEVGCATCIN